MSGSSLYPLPVTSLAEVWIEILSSARSYSWAMSLPLRKCGLKYLSPSLLNISGKVTSLAEVWIEILLLRQILSSPQKSLPLRKCGLKLYNAKK